jgi:hypothetical protein
LFPVPRHFRRAIPAHECSSSDSRAHHAAYTPVLSNASRRRASFATEIPREISSQRILLIGKPLPSPMSKESPILATETRKRT